MGTLDINGSKNSPIQLARVIYWSLELFPVWEYGNLGLSTCAHGGDETFKLSMLGMVDDPSAIVVLVHALDPDLELGNLVQAIPPPQLLDLVQDLLAVRVASTPTDRRVEAVHGRVDLQAGRVVDGGPDAAQVPTRAGLEDDDVEAVADAVRSGRHTRDAGTDDGDGGRISGNVFGRAGREEPVG